MHFFKFLPEQIKQPLIKARTLILYRGTGRYCPVCKKSSSKFGEFGIIPREDAQCMFCGALERHRLTWLYLKEKTDLFDGSSKKMLHVAPETVFQELFAKHFGSGYLTADLYDTKAMVKMDITDIHYPDEAFDVIYCSHVLEHVSDDKKAIREFHRVLKSNGWAILLVPITAEHTQEDSSITDPAERLKLYGQDDHVRQYGIDYIERLREAGFKVKVTTPSEISNKNEMENMGLTKAAGEIYYCTKL